MVQEVYVDILLAVNFFVNLLLLSLVGGRCRCSRGRLVLAACVGALSSLHIFLPPLPVWAGTALGVLLKIGWGAAMVRIAFGWAGLVFANKAVAAFAGLRLGILWADAAAARLLCGKGDVRL